MEVVHRVSWGTVLPSSSHPYLTADTVPSPLCFSWTGLEWPKSKNCLNYSNTCQTYSFCSSLNHIVFSVMNGKNLSIPYKFVSSIGAFSYCFCFCLGCDGPCGLKPECHTWLLPVAPTLHPAILYNVLTCIYSLSCTYISFILLCLWEGEWGEMVNKRSIGGQLLSLWVQAMNWNRQASTASAFTFWATGPFGQIFGYRKWFLS